MSWLAVLSYHKVGEPSPGAWPTWYSVSERAFVGQLAYLERAGWRTIDVATLLAGLVDPRVLAPRSALITFDDGYASLVDSALPLMRERGCPGAVFVATDYVGRTNAFDSETAEPEAAICTWEQLAELERGGLSVHSHGATHRAVSALAPAEVEDELVRSKAAIEERLAKNVDLFAFPYGDGGADARAARAALERAGYRAAFLYKGGPVRLPASDPYRLTRVAVGADTDLAAELDAAPAVAR